MGRIFWVLGVLTVALIVVVLSHAPVVFINYKDIFAAVIYSIKDREIVFVTDPISIDSPAKFGLRCTRGWPS